MLMTRTCSALLEVLEASSHDNDDFLLFEDGSGVYRDFKKKCIHRLLHTLHY